MVADFIKKHINEKSERIHILIDIVAEQDMANIRLETYFAMQPESKQQLKQYLVDLDKLRLEVYQHDIPLGEILAGFKSLPTEKH